MTRNERLEAIPTGLTCEGVNRFIIEYLLDENQNMAGKNIVDMPCGNGELVVTLQSFFPESHVFGCDIKQPDSLNPENFSLINASQSFRVFAEKKFDYVCCVSGVMEFDNTLQFFESCYNHLTDDGSFIVTNDNVIAVRDRISYFWLGKARQFQLFVNQGQVTWKIIPIHNMFRILQDAGFEIQKLDYVSANFRDWLMLPLALLIFPVQLAYSYLSRNEMPFARKRAMYPFRSLICRHYIIVCKKSPKR